MRVERYRQPRSCSTLVSGILLGIIVGLFASLLSAFGLIRSQPASDGLARAQRAFDKGDLDGAIASAQAIWQAQPDHLEALSLLVYALIYRSYDDYGDQSARQRALQLTTEALDEKPFSRDVMALHAYALTANRQFEAASRLADQVLQVQDDHTLARISISLAYSGIGLHENALQEIQKVISAEDWQLEVQRALAISFSGLGRYDDAITAVENAIDLNNRLFALYYERAAYAVHAGKTDIATASYFHVLALDEDNIKVKLRLCELSSTVRESERALSYCQEVIQRVPAWADAWYWLGREYYLRGDFEEARSHLNRCSTLQVAQLTPITERRLDCWYLQGQAAEILNDCDSLLPVYQEFQLMVKAANLPQTWTYPPEGPPICQ